MIWMVAFYDTSRAASQLSTLKAKQFFQCSTCRCLAFRCAPCACGSLKALTLRIVGIFGGSLSFLKKSDCIRLHINISVCINIYIYVRVYDLHAHIHFERKCGWICSCWRWLKSGQPVDMYIVAVFHGISCIATCWWFLIHRSWQNLLVFRPDRFSPRRIIPAFGQKINFTREAPSMLPRFPASSSKRSLSVSLAHQTWKVDTWTWW